MFKKMFFLVMALAVVLSACAPPPAPTPEQPAATEPAQPEKKWVIGMMTVTSHPSLDAIKKGVQDALTEAGYVAGVNVEYIERNAEGDIPTLSTIAQQFVDEKVDIIVATSTPALQAAYKATKDLGGPPIFFNGISNPYTAGVAEAPDKHPAWMIGNQLLDPVADVFKLLLELKPETKIVGMIYNPAEANAAYLIEVAKVEAEKLGIALEFATVANTNEVQTAAESLVGRNLDAFLSVNDNTVTSAFDALAQVANQNDILLLGTSASMPGRGAAASIGVNPYEEGLDSGRQLVQYLKGELDIATATIQIQDSVLLTVNPKAAEEQGFPLPEELIKRADSVIE